MKSNYIYNYYIHILNRVHFEIFNVSDADYQHFSCELILYNHVNIFIKPHCARECFGIRS